MNIAYRSSCIFTDSSTRAWMVTDFGCLGGALMIAMLSFCPPLWFLSYILSYKFSDSLFPARPKHELRVPAARGGSDPRSPKGSGRDFAARWGRSRPICPILRGDFRKDSRRKSLRTNSVGRTSGEEVANLKVQRVFLTFF